ncbi:MAG: DUF6929 family protein [Bacteroidia bacterium]
MQAWTWIRPLYMRLSAALVFLWILNLGYERWGYPQDVARFSPVKSHIDSAFAEADIVYLGESSNTSFNPWTDTLTEAISDFLQAHLDSQLAHGATLTGAPGQKVRAVTHPSYHPGLFLKMLELRGDRKPLVVITVNLRTCGPSAVFSGNEASNQQEALFYSQRPALLTRTFLSLHHYDNRSAAEMERLKRQFWRTQPLNDPEQLPSSPYDYTRDWLDHLAASHYELDSRVRNMADAYVKEFAFVLNEQNQRVQDLKAIAELCKGEGIPLLFHLLPPNYAHAEALFGDEQTAGNLVSFIDRNRDFLLQQFNQWGVKCIDNSQWGRHAADHGHHYTDQWFPTEHYDAGIRQHIAQQLALSLLDKADSSLWLNPPARNRPNPDIPMPLADSLLGVWRQSVGLGVPSWKPVSVRELKEVASASGLEFWNGHYWLVGDNAPYLFEFGPDWSFWAKHPLHSKMEMPDSLYPGKGKPDWESLGVLNNELWILGSGSKPEKRDVALRWRGGHHDSPPTYASVQQEYSLTHLYQDLFGEFDKRKITNNEGLVFTPQAALLANRENNQISVLPLAVWNAVLEGQPLGEAQVFRVQLPGLQGQEASLSGLYIDEQNRLWFTASVELREESTLDGGIAGSFLGYMNPDTWMPALNALPAHGIQHGEDRLPDAIWMAHGKPWKLESLVVRKGRVWAVTDSDGGPSELLEFQLP